jgi:hypothetical protein
MKTKLIVGVILAAFLALGASSQSWRDCDAATVAECGPFQFHRFQTIEEELKQLQPGSWLVLDCTKTLVVPKDPVLKTGHWGKTLEKALGRIPEPHELRRLKLLVEMQARKELVNPRWPHLLAALAEKGVKILVLTKHPTGEEIPGLPSFEEVRSRHLQELGLRFDRWAPELDLAQIQMALPGREIGWFEGVMFAPDGEKGPVLEAVLDSLAESPAEVMVVEDSFAQAQSMADVLRQYAIPSRVLLFRDEHAQAPAVLSRADEQRLREFLSSGVWTP